MTLRTWLFDDTDGTTARGTAQGTANVLSVDGAAATTANPGAGNTITFSSTQAHAGPTSLKAVTTGTATSNTRLPFAASNVKGAVSIYRWCGTFPSANAQFISFLNASDVLLFRVGVSTTGKIFTAAASSTGTLTENRWNRWEIVFNQGTSSTTGSWTINVYDRDTTSSPVTLSLTAQNLGFTTGQVARVDLGTQAAAIAITQYFDSVRMDDGATAEIGPYIPPVTGTLTATAPVLTATSSGTVDSGTITGALTASTPVLTDSLTGTVAAPAWTGTLSASSPLVTGSVAGVVTVPNFSGTLAASTPRTTGASAGTVTGPVYTGTLAATAPPITGSVSGAVATPSGTATLSATLPTITGSISGTTTAPTWTGSLTASPPTVTAAISGTSAGPVVSGVLTIATPPTRSTMAGTVTSPAFTGALSGTTPALSVLLSGVATSPVFVGVLTGALPRLIGNLDGASVNTGDGTPVANPVLTLTTVSELTVTTTAGTAAVTATQPALAVTTTAGRLGLVNAQPTLQLTET